MHLLLQMLNVEQIQIVKKKIVENLQYQYVSISDVNVYRNFWLIFKGSGWDNNNFVKKAVWNVPPIVEH
ncbi:hypothetical protein P8452_74653 [Trifolium repens]|nr:hypothetical protein P8452_74653 [Trifolium repens]